MLVAVRAVMRRAASGRIARRASVPAPGTKPTGFAVMPAILEVAGLRKRFGGIVALDGVALDHRPSRYLRTDRSQWRRQDHAVRRHLRPADRGCRSDPVSRAQPIELPCACISGRGCGFSRTFQECRVLYGRDLPRQRAVCRAGQASRLRAEPVPDRATGAPAMPPRRGAAAAGAGQSRKLRRCAGGGAVLWPAAAARNRLGADRGPKILLLDEPASGVNPTLLNTLRDFLRRIHAERQIVFLIVEHNMEFIMSFASRIVVMHQGQVLARGHARRGAGRPARHRGLSRMSASDLHRERPAPGYGGGRLIVDGVDLQSPPVRSSP